MKYLKLTLTFLLLIFHFNVNSAILETVDFDGPNCLNGALVAQNLLPYHRYTSNSEMRLTLQSCLKIETNTAQKGDIALIEDHGPFATKEVISHAFVLLENGMSFEKHGYSKDDPYQIVETETIFNDYEVEIGSNKAVTYYRCKEKESTEINSDLKNQIKKLTQLEQDLHAFSTREKNNLKEIEFNMARLSSEMISLIKGNPNFSAKDKLLVKLVAAKLVSFSNQLAIFGEPYFRSLVWKWEITSEGIESVFSLLSNK